MVIVFDIVGERMGGFKLQIDAVPDIFARLEASRIVPVVRTGSTELADLAIRALIDSGFQTVEITMSIPGSVELIRQFSAERNLLVGAGTVLNVKEAEDCIAAGARFLVSPVLAEDICRLCKEANVPCILSGLTPTEIFSAWNLGCEAIKVFPVHAMGGPGYLKSLKSVFPSIPLVPTGGVKLANMEEYFRAGASFVGVGSDLVNVSLLQQDPESFCELAKKYLTLTGHL
jgi:2-dehydro-3-deoxyphosphogluconate aldolase/(4S)-4-hydroxy-2-oxoglutarate aldolase